MISLHSLQPARPRKRRHRVGRGIAAGRGKSAGRGTKGQKSRTGSGLRVILPNLPKLKGFRSRYKKPMTINWQKLKDKLKAGEKISGKKLMELGLIKKGQRFKVVGRPKLETNQKEN